MARNQWGTDINRWGGPSDEGGGGGGGGGGTTNWGEIGGNINNQTDLNDKFVEKSNLINSSAGVRPYADSEDTKIPTEKFLQKTLHNIELPEADKDAVNKKYVDDVISELYGKVLKFKGFVATTAPTGSIKDGSLWYEGNALPTTFPVNVKTYNATTSQWSTNTTEYTTEALDLWANLNNDKGYYWFGNGWNMIDDNGRFMYVSTFNGVIGNPSVLYYLDTAYSTYEKGFYRFIPASGGNPAKFVLLNKELFKYVSTFTGETGDVDRLYFLDTEYDTYKVGFYRYNGTNFVNINPKHFFIVSSFTGVEGDDESLYYLDTAYDTYKVGFYRFIPAEGAEPAKFVLIGRPLVKYVSTFNGVVGDTDVLYYLDTKYDDYKVGFYRYIEVEESSVIVGKFVPIGASNVEVDDVTTQMVDDKLQANAIIDVDVFPTRQADIKEGTFYRKRNDHFYDANNDEVIPVEKYICDGEHVQTTAIGLVDLSTGIPMPWNVVTDEVVENHIASGYVTTTETIGDTPYSLYFIKVGENSYNHLMCVHSKVLYHHEDGVWKVVSEDAKPDNITIEVVDEKLQANAILEVDALPTSGILKTTIYRVLEDAYLYNGEEIEQPQGYRGTTDNISVTENGITFNEVEYPFETLTDAQLDEITDKETCEFDDAEWFKIEADKYNYKTTVTKEDVYKLYHNPTGVEDEYVKIGGGEGGSAEVEIDNTTITKVNDKLQANAIIEVDVLPTTNIKEKSVYKIVDKVPEYTDSETIYHDMVKYYYREDGNWVNHSVVNLTQDLYDNLSTEQKTDGTIYVVDDATPVIQGFTYNELANKPSINGITLQDALSLEDLSLYSRSEVNSLLENKGQVEFVDALPATPTTNTWYYSKKYEDGTDVPNDQRALYIVDEDITVFHEMGIVGDIEMETGDTLSGSEHVVTSSQVVKKELSTKVAKYGTQVNIETAVDDATLWTTLAQIGTDDKKTDSSMVFNAGTCYLISSVSPTNTAQIFQFIVTGSAGASAINKRITLINPLTNEMFTKVMDGGTWQAWKGGKKYKHTLVRYNNNSFEFPMGWASIINNKKTITFNDFKNWLKEKGYTTSENSYYLCGGCCGTTGVRNSADTDTAYVGKVASGIFYNEFEKIINKVTYPADTLYFRWDYNGTTQINLARCKIVTEELN